MAIKNYPKGSKTKLSANFHAYEFDCPCSRCKTTPIDDGLVAILQKIRDETGAPVYPNAYRCPEHNAEVPNAGKTSLHMQGMAADISVKGVTPLEVAKIAESIGVKGIGLYDTFVHVDTRTTKFFWKGHEQRPMDTFGGSAENSVKALTEGLKKIAAILKELGY